MTEEIKDEEKKFFRRAGDPLRVQICRVDDPEINIMIRYAQNSGQVPYEHRGWICIDVLGGGLVWRAPDAVFQDVGDGIYVFRDNDVSSN
jgi:hypothetical protein